MSNYEFPKLRKESKEPNGWVKGCCPIHDDKNPSFSYNPETGAWVCFSNCGKGNYEQFLELWNPSELDRYKKEKREKKKTQRRPAKKKKDDRPPIPESYVKNCCEYLTEKPRAYLMEKRGLTEETIKKFQIGWDPEKQRYTIPVRNEKGKLVTIRLYKPTGKRQYKMLPYQQTIKGKSYTYGSPAQLYGLNKLVKHKGKEVIICEGEWDRLLLEQNGFMAVTTTNGCKSFLKEWVPWFQDKDVVIIQDCDDGGQMAAHGIILPMFEDAPVTSIKNVVLPLKGTEKDNDITDYFHTGGFSRDDLRVLKDKTPVHLYEDETEGEKEPIHVLESFIQIEDEQFVNKRIQCEIVISGETSESYYAVRRFKVDHCKLQAEGKCVRCLKTIKIPINSQEYIGSCMSTNSQVIGMLRQFCCKFDKKPAIEILEQVTVQEFFAHQVIKRGKGINKQQEIVEKKCYYISSNDAPPGVYLATGYAKAHPKTQAITFLIESLEPQEDDYQAFNIEKERDNLEAYKALSLAEIIEDLTNHVTNIYQRDEILIAVLLTFFSPLWLRFNNTDIRGWILSIIIGDSGLGKTQTYSRISDYIGVGDFFSCLTGSRTGLAYALTDTPRGWQIKIGRYPANSGKLLTVDEVQHLEEWDLQSISKAMDEGFMQIDRVKSRGYDSMTRLLMLCNPKYDRVMDESMYGCEALKTIFPSTILRRVDFAIFANAGDMTDFTVMNRRQNGQAKITPEMLRAAVFFAWTLQRDQIFFSPEAEKECLNQAIKLSAIFGNAVDIPLVAPSDFRFNLARISAAFACMLMSTDDFKVLTVLPDHINIAVRFILRIYKHASAGLDKYSEIVKLKTHLLDYKDLANRFLKKREMGLSKDTGNYFVKTIYQFKIHNLLRRDDLKDFVGCSLENIKKIISFLKKHHLIKSGRDGYRKQPKFVKFLRELERDYPDFFDIIELDDPGDDPDADGMEWLTQKDLDI